MPESWFDQRCRDLADLDPAVRLAAIASLQPFCRRPAIADRLQGRLSIETDPECRAALAATLGTTVVKTPDDADELQRMLGSASIAEVLGALDRLGDVDPGRAANALPELLRHSAGLVRVQAIRILSRYAPDEALRLTEEALCDPDPRRRLTGLNLLFAFPFEAVTAMLLRLLVAGMLGPETWPVLEALLRNNPDPDFLQGLCEIEARQAGEGLHLLPLQWAVAESLRLAGLRNEPPARILADARRLARERVRRVLGEKDGAHGHSRESPPPEPAPEGQPFHEPATVSIQPIETAAPPSPAVGSDTGPGAVLSAGTVAHHLADGLARLATLTATGRKPSPDEWDRIIIALDDPGRRRQFLAWWRVHPVREPRMIALVTGWTREPDDEVALVALETLAHLAPNRLVTELPELCRVAGPRRAPHAVRLLRRLEGSAFLRRLAEWVDSPDPGWRRAALLGLSQIDFGLARSLISRTLRRTTDPDLLQGLARLLLLHPDPSGPSELRTIARTRDEPAATALRQIAGEIESALQQLTSRPTLTSTEPPPRPPDRPKLPLAVLERIRQIQYRPAFDAVWDAVQPTWSAGRAGAVALALLVVLLAGRWWTTTREDERASFATAREADLPLIIPVRPTSSRPGGRTIDLRPGDRVTGRVCGYDPIARRYDVLAEDGTRLWLAAPRATPPTPGRVVTVRLIAIETLPVTGLKLPSASDPAEVAAWSGNAGLPVIGAFDDPSPAPGHPANRPGR